MYIESNRHTWGTIKYWCNTIESLIIALPACFLAVFFFSSDFRAPNRVAIMPFLFGKINHFR